VTARLIAVVGPTATGKSTLGIRLARRFDGEILACDSTAVYRGLDIGTDKVPLSEQQGIPHHLVDLVDPVDVFSAARYAAEAEQVARAVVGRGRIPILVGGSGFYYRALLRGLFPGPARDDRLRARLGRLATRRGPEYLHRWLSRVDPPSGARIQPRDRMRLVRALEVYLLTGTPLTAHFEATRSALADFACLTLGLRLPAQLLLPRVAVRVDAQLSAGLVEEVDTLLAHGVPTGAHAFSGLVYRQVLDMKAGVRDLAETRALIVAENMQYARRQLSWFRREPGIHWIDAPGESPEAEAQAVARVEAWMRGDEAVERGADT
jgi:tRNA dimethylallyltransferase